MSVMLSLADRIISIHAFRVEGDYEKKFLGISLSISIHAFRVEGDAVIIVKLYFIGISIHAFRVEGDLGQNGTMDDMHEFQSTPSVWKATFRFDYNITVKTISIHAFRVEGDDVERVQSVDNADFNPRLPCGRRRTEIKSCGRPLLFQSTPSVWKATAKVDRGFA